jgi:toxin FitB
VIVLDTNVISELTRRFPAPRVVSWLDALSTTGIAITAITAAELLYGVARLPDGHRKTELAAAVDGLLNDDFRNRILSFDEPAARRYADVVATREQLGRPISVPDAQIAAICHAAGSALATRNTADFDGIGVELVNPWNPG